MSTETKAKRQTTTPAQSGAKSTAVFDEIRRLVEATVNGKTYRVRSCRGAGGQFIFFVPELDIVAVFTSYYATNKPLSLFETVILPAFIDV